MEGCMQWSPVYTVRKNCATSRRQNINPLSYSTPNSLRLEQYLLIIEGFFLYLIENLCCDPSPELSRRDGSDDGSQHMFLCRNDKNYP